MLEPRLSSDTKRSHALSVENKVLITLRFLAKGGFFSELGDIHGTAKSSVSRVFHPTVKGIINVLDNISFPTSETAPQTMIGFYEIGGFPKVLGCVDGTLIPIKRPPIDVEQAYVCRKGYHAINVQGICDHTLRFTNAVVRWPGSSHDSAILSNSRVAEVLDSGNLSGILLGDSGYGCKKWLMTPLLDPKSRGEQRYNTSHLKTRNTIERAFGVLKSRFRCLHKTTGCLPFSTDRCCKVIVACMKLHNFCMDEKVPLPDLQEDDDHPQHPATEVINARDGLSLRKMIIEQVFS
ncbi:hypothetical protein SNE40_016257 [Patella caerulea]